jgi:RHS repeat-associated protein
VQQNDEISFLGNRTIDYTFDFVGNRLSRNDSVAGLTTYLYDANNRLTQTTLGSVVTEFAYDNNGSMIRRSNGSETSVYDWFNDGENRLASVTTTKGNLTKQVEFVYDAQGTRVAVIDDGDRTNYLTGWSLPQVLLEYDEQGNILKDYAYGDGLIRSRTGGAEVFYHMDGLGSTRLLTDVNGIVSDRYNYDAYGVLLTHAGTNNNSFLFAGEQRDSATGLDYLRARYYDPDLGRFISKDPFSGFITDPMSQHDYQYAHANPVRFTDPTGYFSMGEMGATLGLASILASMSWSGAYLAGQYLAGEGPALAELPNLTDQWVAGFAHVVSFGATTYIRNKYIGGIATEHHSGFFWNMGQLAGIGTSLLLGAQAPANLSFAMGLDEWLVVGYEATGTAVSAWQTGTNIRNGQLEWSDTFTLLPLVSIGLSSNGAKAFLTGARAMNDRLQNWGRMLVKASDGGLGDDVPNILSYCFVAGTQVYTPSGQQNIEDLLIGDEVISTDPYTGEIANCKITQAFNRVVDTVLDIIVDSEKITCSPEHPFWVCGKGWLEAALLHE